MSAKAARKMVSETRPSLLGREKSVPVTDYAVRVGTAIAPMRRLWGTPEDTYLILGPSRASKSTWLDNVVFDAPGPVVHTSSKVKDHLATADLRATIGPVLLFNPDNVGGVTGTLAWSPVHGCESRKVAIRRAGYLLYGARRGGAESGSESYFTSNANEVLRALLHAAALAGLGMVEVQRWANDVNNHEAVQLLRQHNADESWVKTLIARQSVADATRDGIYSTLATALSWMSDPDMAAAVTPDPTAQRFDAAQFLRSRGTLYLVGEAQESGAGVAPLFT
ncbi:MAG: hypothetical protein H0T78_11035, partial [Longispora sp.]|nr:hypothetical protein [Longispora sp. (in: high G+C Gram-positive bacteria)]